MYPRIVKKIFHFRFNLKVRIFVFFFFFFKKIRSLVLLDQKLWSDIVFESKMSTAACENQAELFSCSTSLVDVLRVKQINENSRAACHP